jgi:hypothetical protein
MVIAFVVVMALEPSLLYQIVRPFGILLWFLWPPCLMFLVSKTYRADKRAEWKTRPTGMVIAEYVYIFLPPLFFWGLIILFFYAVR